MGRLVEIRDYLPEPNTPRRVNKSSLGKTLSSVLGSLVLSVTTVGPQLSTPVPHSGWGGECKTQGAQVILKEGNRGVSVAECILDKRLDPKWFNSGTVYKDPRYSSK